jgi:hypothetical protein
VTKLPHSLGVVGEKDYIESWRLGVLVEDHRFETAEFANAYGAELMGCLYKKIRRDRTTNSFAQPLNSPSKLTRCSLLDRARQTLAFGDDGRAIRTP